MIKTTMEEIAELASSLDGYCLSEAHSYKNKLIWKCSKGHIFESWLYTVKKGHWCLRCSGKYRLSIEEMHEIAKSRNGKCLSNVYKNCGTKLKWECSVGHIWESTPSNVKWGFWCPYCGKIIKTDINKIKELAVLNSGELLSTEYFRAKDNLKWKCKYGHEWKASYDSVRRGTWCPKCFLFKTESMCREAIENFLGKEFPKFRPKWLLGEKNRPLELDGYCESLNMAFEYQGAQHYKIIETFKMTKEKLLLQKKRDRLKKIECKKRGVKLIIIPEIRNSNKEIVKSKIKEILNKEGIKIK